MDPQEMAIRELTPNMVDAGKALLAELDKARLRVRAALWLYDDKGNGWRLILGADEVDTHGPRWVYRKVDAVLRRMPETSASMELRDVYVESMRHPLLQAVGSVAGSREAEPMRLSQCLLNGVYVEDALLYRMP